MKFTLQSNRSGLALLDQPQLLYALVELAPQAALGSLRLPLNFALVLDQSGSMAGEKLQTMKAAVLNILEQLEPGDVLAIVAFSSKAQVVAPASARRDLPAIRRSVEQLREGGGTNLAPALREALQQVLRHHDPHRVSRIVLLTDGEATDRLEDSRQAADEAGRHGIPIIGLGLGEEWKEDVLFELADRSIQAPPGARVGFADYIPTPRDVSRIFQEVYQSMQMVARDVTVTVRLAQGVEARRVWQAAPLIRAAEDVFAREVIQGRAVVLPLGEMEKSGAAYLLELLAPPRPAGLVRLAQADVVYTLPDGGPEAVPQRLSADLVLEYGPQPASPALNGHVMNLVEKVQAFKLQNQALEEAQHGQVGSATRKLRQAVTILLAQGEPELAEQIQHEADQLEKSGKISNAGKKTMLLTSRKTVRLSE